MNQSDLAERFNQASRVLEQRGHRVVVREARSLLASGRATDALGFLSRAKEALGTVGDDALGGLIQGLRSWFESGGTAGQLQSDPLWISGTAREGRVSALIREAEGPSGGGLSALVDALARHQREIAAGTPLAPLEAPAPKATIGSIFPEGARRPKAVIESLGDLQERPLELEGEAPAAATRPLVAQPPPAVLRKPEPEPMPDTLTFDSEPTPVVETPSGPRVEPAAKGVEFDFGVTPAPLPEAGKPEELRRVERTPAPDLKPQPDPTAGSPVESGSTAKIAVAVLVVLLVAAAVYFFTR